MPCDVFERRSSGYLRLPPEEFEYNPATYMYRCRVCERGPCRGNVWKNAHSMQAHARRYVHLKNLQTFTPVRPSKPKLDVIVIKEESDEDLKKMPGLALYYPTVSPDEPVENGVRVPLGGLSIKMKSSPSLGTEITCVSELDCTDKMPWCCVWCLEPKSDQRDNHRCTATITGDHLDVPLETMNAMMTMGSVAPRYERLASNGTQRTQDTAQGELGHGKPHAGHRAYCDTDCDHYFFATPKINMAPATRLGLRHANPIEPAIGFDPQEEARIRLEQEIGGLSLDLDQSSSTLSLEYGRHGAPSPHFEGVASFARYDSDLDRSREASHIRRSNRQQSFRTVDDSYEGGNTQSTTAHHASAVTVGVGLGYGAGPRPISRAGSGVEYDPDRELSSMLKRRGRISVLDDTNTTVRDRSAPKKKSIQVSSDPLIVEDTAELDRFLETGHIPEHALHPQPRISRRHPTEDESRRTDVESGSSFHRSEADDSFSRRKPRLTDALGGTFSPKRPRTATTATLSPTGHQPKPLPSVVSLSDASVRPSTSLLASRPSNVPTRTETSFSSSSGTQRARLNANTAANARIIPIDAPAPTRRAPSRQDSSETYRDAPAARPPMHTRTQSAAIPRESAYEARNRSVFGGGLSIHLPDITGLTTAVASPIKANLQYRDAQVGMPGSDFDADRSAANEQLEELADRLRDLERENGTARRRVRELEIELEYCKADVERERTREAERSRANERQVANERAERERRVREAEDNVRDWEGRYHEVVEEKKALEALVTTLRSHLARMTAEVEEHQRTIDELRSMHERDTADLQVKTAEVAAITEEVERLAAECDRLRGVVEEGLRERRQVREGGSVQASGSQRDFEGAGSMIAGRTGLIELSAVQEEEEDDGDMETELEGQRSLLSVTELAGEDSAFRSGKMRTDRATVGSVSRTLRFMDPPPSQSDDITPELDRSQSSVRSAVQVPSRSSTPVMIRTRASGAAPGSPAGRRESPLVRRGSDDADAGRQRATTSQPPRAESPTPQQRASPTKTTARDPLRTSQRRSPMPSSPQRQVPPDSPPFPRIRGTQLEQLFFSAPEHNERTCTTCCKRRQARVARDDRHEPERVRERERAGWRLGGSVPAHEDDEGFGEGSDELEIDPHRPPPQTVLVKVVRELEDDFAHYKAIYVELADQYRIIGPASNVAKRNVLAEHLREVIDTLEKRGDQIAALYDLLKFNDKTAPTSSKQTA